MASTSVKRPRASMGDDSTPSGGRITPTPTPGRKKQRKELEVVLRNVTLQKMESRFALHSSWQAYGQYGRLEEESREAVEGQPRLLIAFYSLKGPNNHIFSNYDFRKVDSVVAFIREQLGLDMVSIRQMKAPVGQQGATYSIELKSSVGIETLDRIPNQLIGLSGGAAMQVLFPSRVAPLGIEVIVEGVDTIHSMDDVKAALLEMRAISEVSKIERFRTSGVALERILAYVVLTKWVCEDYEEGGGGLPPLWELQKFRLEGSLKGTSFTVARGASCTCCGATDHIGSNCEVEARITSGKLPVFTFLRTTVEDVKTFNQDAAQPNGSTGKPKENSSPRKKTKKASKVAKKTSK